MTLLFEHKQTIKKYFFRIIFVAAFLLLYYLFSSNKTDYAIFIIPFFLLLLMPSITELKVFQSQVEITVHYGLAMTRRLHTLRRENIPLISPVEVEIDSFGYPQVDSPLSFIFIFFDAPSTIIKYYRIKYTKSGEEKKVDIKLTEEEYRIIKSILT